MDSNRLTGTTPWMKVVRECATNTLTVQTQVIVSGEVIRVADTDVKPLAVGASLCNLTALLRTLTQLVYRGSLPLSKSHPRD